MLLCLALGFGQGLAAADEADNEMTHTRDWRRAGELADAAIRRAEGERGYVYALDGVLHYGIGHRLTADELKVMKHGNLVDVELVTSAYRDDFNTAFSAVIDLHIRHPAELNAARIAVLIEMAFCHGADGLAGYTQMFNAIERGDWDTAAREMFDSRWYREQGAELPAIKERVERLANQLQTGKVAA